MEYSKCSRHTQTQQIYIFFFIISVLLNWKTKNRNIRIESSTRFYYSIFKMYKYFLECIFAFVVVSLFQNREIGDIFYVFSLSVWRSLSLYFCFLFHLNRFVRRKIIFINGKKSLSLSLSMYNVVNGTFSQAALSYLFRQNKKKSNNLMNFCGIDCVLSVCLAN